MLMPEFLYDRSQSLRGHHWYIEHDGRFKIVIRKMKQAPRKATSSMPSPSPSPRHLMPTAIYP